MVRKNRGDFDPALEFRVIRVAARAMPARVEQSSTDRQRDLIQKGTFPEFLESQKSLCTNECHYCIPDILVCIVAAAFCKKLDLSEKSKECSLKPHIDIIDDKRTHR